MFRRMSRLLLLVVLTMFMQVLALAEDITPYYSYTNIVRASLSISGGRATSSGAVIPYDNRATRVTVKLQQYIDGGWRTIGEWTASKSSGRSEVQGSEEVDRGYEYRTQTIGTVLDSDGNVLETIREYSLIESY